MTRTLYELARSQVLVVATRSVNLATDVLTPLLLLTLLVLPRVERLTPREATGAVTGVLLASLWGASLWSGAGILRRERWFATLGPSFAGRSGALTVLLGKTLGGVLYDVSVIALSTSAFLLAAGVRLEIRSPVAFAVGLVAVVLGGLASSLLIGAGLMLSRYAFQLTTALGTPILLLGGTIIPHDVLPAWAGALGDAVNLAWLQRFMASTAGAPDWQALGAALALTAAYAAIGARLVHVMLRRARREATLELA